MIDWFTVGAQVVNFLVLVALLKHFLFKPILKAIDAREKRIADQLADAASKKVEAQKELDDLFGKNEVLDKDRSALLDNAKDAARIEGDRVIAEARKGADALRIKQGNLLQLEYANLKMEISQRITTEVFAIARKALTDLASASLEQYMGDAFTRHLEELDANDKAALSAALQRSSDRALVRSRFELSVETKATIDKSLHTMFSRDTNLTFETDPDALCGVELSVLGQKIVWSMSDYLATLEASVSALVDAQVKPESA